VELKGFRGLGRACEKFFTTTINTQNQLSTKRVLAWETRLRSSTDIEPTAYYTVERNPLGSRERIFASILLNLLSSELLFWFHGTNIRLLYTYSRYDTNHDRGIDKGWDIKKVALGTSIRYVSMC
jgi:hypothetical protein